MGLVKSFCLLLLNVLLNKVLLQLSFSFEIFKKEIFLFDTFVAMRSESPVALWRMELLVRKKPIVTSKRMRVFVTFVFFCRKRSSHSQRKKMPQSNVFSVSLVKDVSIGSSFYANNHSQIYLKLLRRKKISEKYFKGKFLNVTLSSSLNLHWKYIKTNMCPYFINIH